MNTLLDWLGDRLYMPHGHCYLWQPAMVWLQVLTNVAIGAAYMAITVTLVVLVRRSRDIPFSWVYVAFAVFIVTCGLTHFSDVLVIWKPAYWLDGGLRAITAVASVATALLLPPLVPKAIALTEAARLSHERGFKLEEANAQLERLLAQSTELERLKTEFFANVSHELRTPLALVLGPTATLLARPDLDAAARQELLVVQRNARSLLKHVNDLLDVARLEAGRMPVARARIDAARVVRRVAGQFESVAEERQLALAVEAPAALVADVDPGHLERVLLNLVSNAVKFTPPGGAVRCVLDAADGELRIVVTDSGPGIPAERRADVFERFRQLDGGTTRRFGGTGLGLAITRDLVVLHGGTIDVDEAPGGGARFTVRLPRHAPAGEAVRVEGPPGEGVAPGADDAVATPFVDELRASGASPAPPAPVDDARPRVLIAEDNADMRRFIADALAPRFAVTAAPDGARAIELALAAPPDLVITDVMMPNLGGDEVVRRLRAEPHLEAVPVMLLTAKADDELRVRMLREGAQDYLMKPFAVEELVARAVNLVTMKRSRDVLQRAVATQHVDLEHLAGEVAQRQRELETTLEAMRVARGQAEAASRAKSAFIGLISHELRTPLGALSLQLERLALEPLPEGPRALTVRMQRTSARLADLIESLLTYTRLQGHRLEAARAPVDLAALAREVVEELAPRAEAKGLALGVSGAPPPLSSDARLLRLILVNLVDNAIKYTARGEIRVTLDARPGEVALAVRDTGPGISPDDQVRIFQPFEQLEPLSAKRTPGVGLGLTIVRDLVAALGARLELTSAVGAGSTFCVVLPTTPEARP